MPKPPATVGEFLIAAHSGTVGDRVGQFEITARDLIDGTYFQTWRLTVTARSGPQPRDYFVVDYTTNRDGSLGRIRQAWEYTGTGEHVAVYYPQLGDTWSEAAATQQPGPT